LAVILFLLKLIPTLYSIFKFSSPNSKLFFLFDGLFPSRARIIMYYFHFFGIRSCIGLLILLSEFVPGKPVVILLVVVQGTGLLIHLGKVYKDKLMYF